MQFRLLPFIRQSGITLGLALSSFTALSQSKPTKDAVAIYHFTTSRDYSYDYALGVGNAVEAGVLKSNRFRVVERNRFGLIKEEDKFKEANTTELVSKAGKLGAKIIITGHVTGVSRGNVVNSSNVATGNEYVDISLSFKLVDVASGEIVKSEIVRGEGKGKNYAEAAQYAYVSISDIIRAHIGAYLPQRFKYMSTVSTGTKKRGEYLDKFKIWGGSDDGLQINDVVDIYSVSYLTNPNTNQKVEEKQSLGKANVLEINSGSTATCRMIDGPRNGVAILQAIKNSADNLVIEYKGNWYEKRTLLDILGQ
ncbi:MAG TPA: CsgG/HfaB family protein [Flavipsychrobacter sp.]|nr:CsgG/HfaB family protein [Flavipsychrobacter sp.]